MKLTDRIQIRCDLRARYRDARDRYDQASSPVARKRWASEMAVAISELQHPSLADLDSAPTV